MYACMYMSIRRRFHLYICRGGLVNTINLHLYVCEQIRRVILFCGLRMKKAIFDNPIITFEFGNALNLTISASHSQAQLTFLVYVFVDGKCMYQIDLVGFLDKVAKSCNALTFAVLATFCSLLKGAPFCKPNSK